MGDGVICPGDKPAMCGWRPVFQCEVQNWRYKTGNFLIF